MPSEPIALIDLDGTLADFNGAMKSQMAELATPFELTQYPNLENEDLPWIKARRRLIKRQPGFWEGLTPIPEGFAALRAQEREVDHERTAPFIQGHRRRGLRRPA